MEKAKELSSNANNPKPIGCIVVRDGAIVSTGTNSHMGYECKRAGYPTGVGYELCEGCQYTNHAEAEAVNGDVEGGDLYMYGHSYMCDPCTDAVKNAKIKNIYINEGK